MFLPNTDTASVKATREGLLAHKLPSESKAFADETRVEKSGSGTGGENRLAQTHIEKRCRYHWKCVRPDFYIPPF